VVEKLPSKHEALSSNGITVKRINGCMREIIIELHRKTEKSHRSSGY
jgi:hypothetical protein